MASYNVSFDQVRERLNGQTTGSAWVAVALWRQSPTEPYQVMRWWAYVVPKTTGWKPWEENRLLQYRHWCLERLEISIEELEVQLQCWAANESYVWGEDTWTFPEAQSAAWSADRWWAYSSRQYRHRLIPMTSWHYRFSPHDRTTSYAADQDHDFIAPGQPYFPTVRDALRNVVDGIPSPAYGDSLTEREFGLFVLDHRPRIQHIWVRRSGCEVTVEGLNGQACELKLFTVDPVASLEVTTDGSVHIPWEGIPNTADFVLTTDHEVLDRKTYNEHPVFGSGFQVEVDWGEPNTLHQWVAQGEGPQIEFKKDIPRNGEDIAETVCAFANANGGRLFIGVDDHAQIVGTRLGDKWEEGLRSSIRNRIEPTVDATITSVPWEDEKSVVIIDVPAGESAYAVNRDKPVWYLRVGSTDMPARYADVEAMLVKKAAGRLQATTPRRYGF